jgi:DNA-binding NtrC family response regulator
MQSSNIILLQSDPKIAQSLVATLSRSFGLVHVVPSVEDLRNSVAKHRAGVAVVDVERVPLSDVQHLSEEFPEVRIVCNHRLADDEMWTAALNAGAADCCASDETQSIVDATLRSASLTRSASA